MSRTVFSLGVLPIGLSLLLAVASPRLTLHLSGRAATIMITAVALAVASSTGLVVCAIGCLAVAQWAPLAALGHWSPSFVTSRDPLPFALVIASGATAIALVAATGVRLIILARRLAWSARMCRRLGREHASSLIVIDDERAEAYALAGLPGRTIVTKAMLQALPGCERRALLAHERSHVTCFHFVYVSLVELAAAANPLLRPLYSAVRLSVERWADDDAAAEVSDRDLVARALARAGLARNGGDLPVVALGAVASDLAVRLDSLVDPHRSPARAWIGVGAVITAVLACVLSSGLLGLHLHNIVEAAQTVGPRHSR